MSEIKRGLLEKDDEAKELALAKETEAKQTAIENLRQFQENSRQESDKLLRQIDELREALAASERNASRTEDRMRREREDLMLKLSESETRHEELSGSLSSSTRPLLRQIESLQASLSEAQTNSDRVERSLSDRLQQASVQLAAAQERERNAAEQYRQLSSKTATIEAKNVAHHTVKTNLEKQVEKLSIEVSQLKIDLENSQELNGNIKSTLGKEINELKSQLHNEKIGLEATKQDFECEKQKNVALIDQLKDRDKRIKEMSIEVDKRAKSSSPSFSIASINSVEQNWPDEVFESRNIGPGLLSNGPTSALLESLQSQLKQKEVSFPQHFKKNLATSFFFSGRKCSVANGVG